MLLSTDGGATWSDLTQDGDPTQAEFTHPDQHAIVTLPGKPFMYWEGSDGGIVSSDGKFSDVSAKCDARGLNAANLALCKSLLWRVPHQLANNINRGFSTLQFQSLSVSQQHPRNILQGGTQDNGTWQNSRKTSSWNQIIYGDGGQSGFSSTDEAVRFNTFTGQAHDANFRNGDPTKWVIISAPIITSPEASLFYPPIIADPNPSSGGTIFQGSFSVWRTQDWGGNQAFLEANCPEFTTSAAQPGCGDFVRIGGAPTSDLTSTVWGSRGGNAAVGSQTPGNQYGHAVGRDRHRARVHLRQRGCRRRLRRLESRRPESGGDDQPQPVRHGNRRRSRERASRLDHVLGLQLQYAGAAGPHIRSHLDRDRRGHLHGHQSRPA